MSGELLAYRLLTLHNLTFFHSLMAEARMAVESARFDTFRSRFFARYAVDTAPEGIGETSGESGRDVQ
jgi:tRNA-guanine family transglycosylase